VAASKSGNGLIGRCHRSAFERRIEPDLGTNGSTQTHSETNNLSIPERRIRRSDGGYVEVTRVESETNGTTGHAHVHARVRTDAESALQFREFEIVAFKGPIPAPWVLAEYDEVCPGAASRWRETHLRNETVRAEAVERLSRSESTATTMGALTVPFVAIVGLIGAIALIFSGHSVFAVAVAIPAVLAATAQVIAATRSTRNPPENE